MSAVSYTRYELLRTVRNRRFFVLSLGFPLVLFFLIAGPQRNVHDFDNSGISAPMYYMVGMVAFGTMSAMLSCGARIASERAVGWNRQLRISPLTTRSYFRAKVLTAYLMALLTMAVLYVSGASLGVSMSAGDWLEMTLLILACLVPFAALGIAIGHMLTPESIGPAMGGGVALLAFLGGTWFPIPSRSGSAWSISATKPTLSGKCPTRNWETQLRKLRSSRDSLRLTRSA